jgi:hypothetical protein
MVVSPYACEFPGAYSVRCLPVHPGYLPGEIMHAGNPFAPARLREASLNCSSTAYQLDHQNHQRNDQQNVDVPRNHMESNKADQPKNQ